MGRARGVGMGMKAGRLCISSPQASLGSVGTLSEHASGFPSFQQQIGCGSEEAVSWYQSCRQWQCILQ